MKILFFTPTLITSAIGRVSYLVVRALEELGHDVTVIRSEDPSFFTMPTHPFPSDLVGWNETSKIRDAASKADLVIYQIGNNYPFHCGCLEWLPILPGVISLHDYFLGHLFWGWSDVFGRDKTTRVLESLYGKDVAARFFNHADSESFITYTSEFAPMTEWIVSMASGVITHSRWTMERIIKAASGPVEVVPLPYNAPYLKENIFPSNDIGTKERVVILTIGHVNVNKRYASIINAIATDQYLQKSLEFRIVGTAESSMIETLQQQADQCNVQIVMTGAVDDELLAEEIDRADIMCCLRWPALESASASTIESMLYGKPTVVTRTGFYLDLPDDCVVKISPESEIEELCSALKMMVSSSAERVAMGERGREYALKTFRADNYARRIVAMKQKLFRVKIINSVAHGLASRIGQWGSGKSHQILEYITSPLKIFK